jgi:hypothetical protein
MHLFLLLRSVTELCIYKSRTWHPPEEKQKQQLIFYRVNPFFVKINADINKFSIAIFFGVALVSKIILKRYLFVIFSTIFYLLLLPFGKLYSCSAFVVCMEIMKLKYYSIYTLPPLSSTFIRRKAYSMLFLSLLFYVAPTYYRPYGYF